LATPSWKQVPGVAVIQVTQFNDGTFAIIGTNGSLFTTPSLATPSWKHVPGVAVIQVSRLYDGSFAIVGLDGKLFTTPSLSNPTWKQVPGLAILQIIEFKNPGVISTFANISRFGAGGGNSTLILLLLLIIAAVVYYLYTQGKIKIPSFEQRMAQFGKSIKSLRRRR
jgi:hypothetical protein